MFPNWISQPVSGVELDDAWFKVNGVRYEGSVLYVRKLLMSWTPKKFSEITAESFDLVEYSTQLLKCLLDNCALTTVSVQSYVRTPVCESTRMLKHSYVRTPVSEFNGIYAQFYIIKKHQYDRDAIKAAKTSCRNMDS